MRSRKIDIYGWGTAPLLVMVLMMSLPRNAIAITADGGAISSSLAFSVLAASALGSGINSSGAMSWAPNGNYSGPGYYGSFVIKNSLFSQSEAPASITITLISPAHGSGGPGAHRAFAFNASSSGTIANCSLFVNGTLEDYSGTITGGAISSLSANGLGKGTYSWNITCSLDDSSVFSSENRIYTRAPASDFDDDTTDFSSVNMSAIPNLTLSRQANGRIVFSGLTDLSQGYDLDSYVRISGYSIIVDSESVPGLNKSATLSIYNFNYTNGAILRNGVECQDCAIISNSGGTFTFSVSGFSNYTITSASALSVYDDSDTVQVVPLQQLYFYADYHNTTSGAPIPASCNITYLGGEHPMPFNVTSGIYYYNASFALPQTFQYNVSCSPTVAGFDALALSDEATVIFSSSDGPVAANVTFINSSRKQDNLSTAGTGLGIDAGDVSNIQFSGTRLTSFWQGFYGKTTGNLFLGSGNGSVFYEWTNVSASGEAMAVRSPTVDWPSVRCANQNDFQAEEAALGFGANERDSINSTFSNSTSFTPFVISGTYIAPGQDCYATRLRTAGGQAGNFTQVLLHDDNQVIYTAIINSGQVGFNSNIYDFEMLVAEDGTDPGSTVYYFFMEIG